MTTKTPGWHNRLANAFYARLGRWGKIHFWRICLREIDPGQTYLSPATEGFEFELLDEAAMRELADSNCDVSTEFVENSIVQGDTCLVVRKNAQLMGYSWRTRCTLEFSPGMWMCLTQPNTFFGFKTWIDPRARGMRLFEKMRKYLDLRSVTEGTQTGIAYINLTNLDSWASLKRDPLYRQVGWCVHGSWGSAGWTLLTPGAGAWIVVDGRE